ncbi:MAG: acyl carrier protein [Phycisphaerae bacterium]
MTVSSIADRVQKVMVEEFELAAAALTPDADLYSDLGLDSLDAVDLVVALKEEFGFEADRRADEEKVRGVRTMADLYAFVEWKLGASSAVTLRDAVQQLRPHLGAPTSEPPT